MRYKEVKEQISELGQPAQMNELLREGQGKLACAAVIALAMQAC